MKGPDVGNYSPRGEVDDGGGGDALLLEKKNHEFDRYDDLGGGGVVRRNDEGDTHCRSDDDYCGEWFESVRSRTGLEIAVQIKWPDLVPFEVSTCLSEREMAPMFHGTQWAGTRIWNAAIVALRYLLSNGECPIDIDDRTTVVELGAGLGVPGIVLHALRGCNVVLTDLECLVDQIRSNLEGLPEFARSTSTRDTASNRSWIRAEPLDWSERGVRELLEKCSDDDDDNDDGDDHGVPRLVDVVLCCDCIFEPLYGDSWRMLAECQRAFLSRNPDAYVLTAVERRRYDGIDKYLDALRGGGGRGGGDNSCAVSVARVEKVVPVSFDYPPEVELYRLYRGER